MEKFYLDNYIKNAKRSETEKPERVPISASSVKESELPLAWSMKESGRNFCDQYVKTKEQKDFFELCAAIGEEFLQEWEENQENMKRALEIQKKAIIGYENEVNYFKSKIREALRRHEAEDTPYPQWYDSLTDGIYHENWGLAGISRWFSENMRDSSSAKIIGDNIYFMEKGQMVLQPQKISKARRKQLVRAFLLRTPEERMDKECHEVYMLDGTRVTVFQGAMVKEDRDVIVFRRYIIPVYSFEEQAARGTIPREAIPLFKEMVRLGFNVAFTGAVRTAKTTFLSTWQSYEDRRLEGVMVETDPEIPLHKLMPEVPIIQLIADGDKLKAITKNLLRSDADYIIMAEAREGVALDTVLKMASKGTRRLKITFHTRDPLDFPYDVAAEIVKSMGGEIDYVAGRAAASFDYIFHFVQLADKNCKRLKSIYEIGYDKKRKRIREKQICGYDYEKDSWKWYNVISEDKQLSAEEEDAEAFARFAELLSGLSSES